MKNQSRKLLSLTIAVMFAAPVPLLAAHEAISADEVLQSANEFFKTGSKGLGEVLGKVLKEKGNPVAIIRGEEVGGAIGVGLHSWSASHFSVRSSGLPTDPIPQLISGYLGGPDGASRYRNSCRRSPTTFRRRCCRSLQLWRCCDGGQWARRWESAERC